MDTKHELITASIKAYKRPNAVKKCIESVVSAGIRNIFIGYDGGDMYLDAHKEVVESFQEKYSDIDINLLCFEFNYGISAVRNRLAEAIDTKYILQLDDDNYVPSNVLDIIDFLELDDFSNFGAVGFGWIGKGSSPDLNAYDLDIKDGYCIRYFNLENKMNRIVNNLIFTYPFDFIPNQAIYRTAVFSDIKWDENFKINREHLDFMLRLKLNTNWKLAVTPSIWCIHDKIQYTGDEIRRREYRKSVRYFLKKWSLQGIYPPSYLVKYISGRRTLLDLEYGFKYKYNLKKLMERDIYKQ